MRPGWTIDFINIRDLQIIDRFVANCFPHHGYIWNYGAIPQTWEVGQDRGWGVLAKTIID